MMLPSKKISIFLLFKRQFPIQVLFLPTIGPEKRGVENYPKIGGGAYQYRGVE